jgi:hypothetical protein
MEKFEFFLYEPYLSEANYSHLQNCAMAFREEQYFASAIWGSVFLEGFLAEIFRDLNVEKNDFKVLNDYIEHLKNLKKREKGIEITVPQEMINKCNLIREIRNGLVHDTGYSKGSIKSEAQTVLNSITILLDLYKKHFPIKDEIVRNDEEDLIKEENLIPVFISTINPDTEIQNYFIELFYNRLRKIGIKPVRAVLDDYDENRPMERIVEFLEECEGIIVIGLERSHAYFLRDRVGGVKQEDKMHTKYTSSWLHLEAALAHALGKDVFVTCQLDIYSDGIFDREWNSYKVIEFKWPNNFKDVANLLKEGSNNKLNNTFFPRLEKWVKTKQMNK